MTSIRNPFTWSTVAILALLSFFTTASSCRNPQGHAGAQINPDGSIAAVSGGINWDPSTNVNVSATGSLNPATGEWSGNLLITFRAQPDDQFYTFVSQSGASQYVNAKAPGVTQFLLKYDSSNRDHRVLIAEAQRRGALISGMK
jgi:hypothetical protein